MKKSSQKTFLKDFVIVAVKFVQSLLNLAQIARWNSATPNADVFVRKRTKTALCYVPHGRFDTIITVGVDVLDAPFQRHPPKKYEFFVNFSKIITLFCKKSVYKYEGVKKFTFLKFFSKCLKNFCKKMGINIMRVPKTQI